MMKRMDVTFGSRVRRSLWKIFYILLFRPSPNTFFFWRVSLLRLFGAELDSTARVYPTCLIWDPRNLVMGRDTCVADRVNVYNVAPIVLGEGAVVSQDVYLCTASKSYWDGRRDLLVAPIEVGRGAWVACAAFICPGVTVGDGSTILARCFVSQSVKSGHVVKNLDRNITEEIIEH